MQFKTIKKAAIGHISQSKLIYTFIIYILVSLGEEKTASQSDEIKNQRLAKEQIPETTCKSCCTG